LPDFLQGKRKGIMPIYAYRCDSCGFAKDVLQKMSDAPLSQCPGCGKDTFRKQVTAAGFQLKGSGWYVTDFRNGSGANGKSNDANGANGANDSANAKSSGDGAAAGADSSKPASSDTAGAGSPSAVSATPAASTGSSSGTSGSA
jgi:putative FmdB family regulatory protein